MLGVYDSEVTNTGVIEWPLKLEQVLSQRSKQELTEVRTRYGFKGLSSLNKTDLASRLAALLPEAIGDVLDTMDRERLDTIQRLVKNDGMVPGSAKIKSSNYYKFLGLAFNGTVKGKSALVMPEELVASVRSLDGQAWKSYQQNAVHNEEIIKLSMGMMEHYGALRSETLLELLSKYVMIQDVEQILRVIQEYCDYDGNMLVEGKIFFHSAVEDYEEILREHDMRASIPYYPFTKAELLDASRPDFVEQTPVYLNLMKYLRSNYGMSKSDAQEVIDGLTFGVQMGMSSLHDMVQEIQHYIEFDSMDDIGPVADQLVLLYNGTRQWFLKGNSPSELSHTRNAASAAQDRLSGGSTEGGQVLSFATGLKVGRNDPCPCGSGKKFKKCCGS
ncbi:hypothetical protein SY83_22120 [Paenibacillus swuensis]|uniref:Zinc chelation protein SecC n=1 Tax=Paenibacillus swuensis TaxID=1178515 RepID=A0A172TN96_9BACL|nr:hypothetical protein SY83_22120 [Paenibacillus swuensis]